MNVLSLFDGLGGARIALDKADIKVTNYFASEIDKYCIKVSSHNYPDIIHLGDITKIDLSKLPKIDLLIGGSPCQSLSIACNQKESGLDKGKSILFWEYYRVLNEMKPKFFILENVASMKRRDSIKITSLLGVKPLKINSSLVSAQNRERLYWTNIKVDRLPVDKKIYLKDIVHEYRNEEFEIDKYITPLNRSLTIINSDFKKGKIGYFGNKDSQGSRVYSIFGKSVTLCSEPGGVSKTGQYLFNCFNSNFVNKKIKGGRFSKNKRFYILTPNNIREILHNGYIRKLTPVECERLQNIPDNYTNVEGVSENQRYKMIGNSFTIDVIVYLLECLKKNKKTVKRKFFKMRGLF